MLLIDTRCKTIKRWYKSQLFDTFQIDISIQHPLSIFVMFTRFPVRDNVILPGYMSTGDKHVNAVYKKARSVVPYYCMQDS